MLLSLKASKIHLLNVKMYITFFLKCLNNNKKSSYFKYIPIIFHKGIWADSSDEDDNSYRKGKKRKNYMKPINFISGGFKGTEKKEKEVEKDDTSLQVGLNIFFYTFIFTTQL